MKRDINNITPATPLKTTLRPQVGKPDVVWSRSGHELMCSIAVLKKFSIVT